MRWDVTLGNAGMHVPTIRVTKHLQINAMIFIYILLLNQWERQLMQTARTVHCC